MASTKEICHCVLHEREGDKLMSMCLPARSNWWKWHVGRMKLSIHSASRMEMNSVQVGYCCICSNVFGPVDRNHLKSAADTLRLACQPLICYNHMHFQRWPYISFAMQPRNDCNNMQFTGMYDYIIELFWLIPAYLQGVNKQLHVSCEVNTVHVNQWPYLLPAWTPGWMIWCERDLDLTFSTLAYWQLTF